jgi:hypothetical protein
MKNSQRLLIVGNSKQITSDTTHLIFFTVKLQLKAVSRSNNYRAMATV